MTTAYYRTEAYDLEARCEWARAADAYQKAIDLYPAGRGALRDADISKLAARRDACASFANAAHPTPGTRRMR